MRDRPVTGRVTLVGGGPGAPDLITVRGQRALEAAEVVLYDALVDEELLEGTKAMRVYVGKRCGRHAMTQEEINDLLVSFAATGKRVVRLKGGDPNVLGRGGEEGMALTAAGIPFEVVPGVTSAVAASALTGIPLTHRGVADGFTLVSAHPRNEDHEFSIPPFHPSRTLILLMGVRTVAEWAARLLELGYPAALPVAFVTSVSRPGQRLVETTVGAAARDAEAENIETPSLVIVGEVVALRAAIAGSDRTERPRSIVSEA